MKLAVGADEHNAMTARLLTWLAEQGHGVRVYGALPGGDDAAWVGVGTQVAQAVATGEADEGVVCCWTGTGVSIAANKVPGIRAALCTDAETARGARRWNAANVLALSLRLTSEAVLEEILEAWFAPWSVDPEDQVEIDRLAGR